MTFNFLGPGLTVNVEAKVKEQIILDSSGLFLVICCRIYDDIRKSLLDRRKVRDLWFL